MLQVYIWVHSNSTKITPGQTKPFERSKQMNNLTVRWSRSSHRFLSHSVALIHSHSPTYITHYHFKRSNFFFLSHTEREREQEQNKNNNRESNQIIASSTLFSFVSFAYFFFGCCYCYHPLYHFNLLFVSEWVSVCVSMYLSNVRWNAEIHGDTCVQLLHFLLA